MAKFVKKVLSKIIPKRFHPSSIMYRAIIAKTHNQVISGPFIGMKSFSALYMLGTYELELHPLIEELCKKSFGAIINVGAAHGYYAVGLGLRNPQAHITAFEADAEASRSLKKMVQLNNINNRTNIKGFCDSASLSDNIPDSGKCLIVMDIEGGEAALLDPFVIPKLRKCHILVELHEFVLRQMAEIITKRFEATHKITEIWSRKRIIADFPIKFPSSILTFLLEKYYLHTMDEDRCERQRWFYLEPNAMNEHEF